MPYPKLERAISFAIEAHAGHYRKGASPLPYIVHPLDVMQKTRHMGGITDEEALTAAVLHDVVEDTAVTIEEIEHHFGERVSGLVRQLTRRVDKSDQRYSEMLLEDVAAMDEQAQIIKLCDRLSNLAESVGTRPGEKTRPYAMEAIRMLEIVPRERAPEVWDSLMTLAKNCVANDQKGDTVREMEVTGPPDK